MGNTVCVNVYPSGSTCKTRLNIVRGGRTRTLSANTAQVLGKPDSPTIYPNPNTGNFTVKIAPFKIAATASLYNLSGKKIKAFNLDKEKNKIQNKGLPTGDYLMILYIDGKKEIKKLIIN